MHHDTVTVTRTKALVTAPTALVIARAISHGRQIQPHYPVIDRAADRAIWPSATCSTTTTTRPAACCSTRLP